MFECTCFAMILTFALCKILWLNALVVLTARLFVFVSVFITRANEEVNTDPNSSPNASHSFCFSSWASPVCHCCVTTSFCSLKANPHRLGSCRCGKNRSLLPLAWWLRETKHLKNIDTGKERPFFFMFWKKTSRYAKLHVQKRALILAHT